MKVNVGGYDLICVSTVKKIHLKLIPPTVVFINDYIVKLVIDIIHKIVNHESISGIASTRAKAPFSLGSSSTPNSRDKVWWSPERNCYIVTPKLANGTVQTMTTAVISLALAHEEYLESKERDFWIAVKMWNSTDKSTRERIPEELVTHASRV